MNQVANLPGEARERKRMVAVWRGCEQAGDMRGTREVGRAGSRFSHQGDA